MNEENMLKIIPEDPQFQEILDRQQRFISFNFVLSLSINGLHIDLKGLERSKNFNSIKSNLFHCPGSELGVKTQKALQKPEIRFSTTKIFSQMILKSHGAICCFRTNNQADSSNPISISHFPARRR